LERLGVASGMAFFPDLERKAEALFFRYPEGWKARAFPEKSFVAGKGLKLAFWNIERVLAAAPQRVFIVEGELDACALVEAGVPPEQVLSVPNGAKDKPAEAPQEQRGYAYVDDALRAGLSRVKQFVWCGDGDGPGHALRSDMARLLGAARFWFVEWPEGCKDANDLLRTDGHEAVYELVMRGALMWPVDGLYRLADIPEPAPLTLWRPGFAEWESKVMLAPRTLSVVTGQPGHGKTQLWQQIWFQVVRAYCAVACIASFETRAKPHIRRQLRSLFLDKLEKHANEEEISRADAWINDRYLFLVHPDQRPTLEWFLDMAEVAVIRHEARIIQVDPWNRLEDQRGRDESKTDYIGRCLKTLHAFAHDMNCHVQILAHPAKMDSKSRHGPPTLEDISDSKNWENMVDQGFVVHRPEIFDGTSRKTEAVLYHRKARFEELGFPCKLGLNFNLDTGRYVSTDYQTGVYA
jgi:twinkle protein